MNTTRMNILIVGPAQCGKTAYLTRHSTGEFPKQYTPDMSQHDITTWTTAGIYIWKCQSLTPEKLDAYEEKVDGIILMVDLTDMNHVQQIKTLAKILSEKYPNIPGVVTGNKIDINIGEEASSERMRKIPIKEMNGWPFYPISAKSNYNFDRPFLHLLRQHTNSQACFVEAQV